jgi:hypothetical protein
MLREAKFEKGGNLPATASIICVPLRETAGGAL